MKTDINTATAADETRDDVQLCPVGRITACQCCSSMKGLHQGRYWTTVRLLCFVVCLFVCLLSSVTLVVFGQQLSRLHETAHSLAAELRQLENNVANIQTQVVTYSEFYIQRTHVDDLKLS